MFKTGMDSMCPHATQNTKSCHGYAEAEGSRWEQMASCGAPEAGKVHFLNWF